MLHSAVDLADTEGIAAVALSSVAVRAGLSISAARRTFSSRDRLVAAMVQHVTARRRRVIAVPQEPITTLTRYAEEEWRNYRTHPWLVGVMASTRPPLVPAVLEASGAAIEAFTALGLDAQTALSRYLALSGYIQGMGLLLMAEHTEAVYSESSQRSWWQTEGRRLDRSGARRRHRWLGELTDDRAAEFDLDAVFDDGLPRVIRGLTG
ncbi:MAG TPA: TetR/AcrR family transcriptional regulator C-terminal domain-containing protein [Beutenbergiaceae bacterium]|nr:TetR/AcrR family transcriptional regulator C-terminal domain-containing protein [Beutenbergiaceae bacterium]